MRLPPARIAPAPLVLAALAVAALAVACAAPPEPPTVTTFALNVHEWGFVGESAAAVERVLDLHEAYGVPVDVYLTDPMVRAFREEAPQVLDRLRASPLAAVSYHVRPPHPYYPNFDWLGLGALDADDRFTVMARYESHGIDLATGEPTLDAGGYALLAELMGYPPFAVGPAVSPTYAAVLAERGAVFEVKHEAVHDLGDAEDGLALRPEHVEVKLYDSFDVDGCAVLEARLADTEVEPATGPRFVNVKWHENNFFARAAAWKRIYYVDDAATIAAPGPWDLSSWRDEIRLMDAPHQVERWDLYESAVACVAADPERWNPANLRDVAGWLAEGT